MIIYLGEDGAYLAWLGRHRDGFVLDALRKPTRKPAALHRAACSSIRKSPSRTTHWTTGRHLKACSLDWDELAAWASAEYGGQPVTCDQCAAWGTAPGGQRSPEDARRGLTRLGRQVLDCVIDSAVIHLDNGDGAYDLAVSDLADRLGKSPAQIAAPLAQLEGAGLLHFEGDLPASARRRVYPTASALRLLPTFEALSETEIAEELDRLHHAAATA
jgi:hypothetical protein